MPDIVAISQALSALTQATDIVKAIRSADRAYEVAELKLKIADLADALTAARLSVMDAQSEIQALKDQHARARASAQAKPTLRNGVYYIVEGETESGPYCPRCLDTDRQRMRLTTFAEAFKAIGTYNCPQCEAVY